MAVGGFSPVVSEKAEEAKDRWGPLAYLRGAVGALPELQGFDAVLTLEGPDGPERLRVETYNLVLSNGRYVASGIPVAPHSILDDGLLDVMIVPTASFAQLALLVPQVLLGRHLESELVLLRRASRVEVESDPAMAFNVDGEVIGEGPAAFEVLPGPWRWWWGTWRRSSPASCGRRRRSPRRPAPRSPGCGDRPGSGRRACPGL